MLKLLRLTATLATTAISFLPCFSNPVLAQSLDHTPEIEFTSIHVGNDHASGYITNRSNQNVTVERINVVVKNQKLQIVAGFYLEPGQAIRFRNARIAGPSTSAYGYAKDILNWLDDSRYGYINNFLTCRYITGSGDEGAYSLGREKQCTSK